ncbi:CLUMA_CG010531, isoform A [Clunio marinus]|uniref:CLUMA_CG010531, isoform A n=1 Tax=Clunio marinus TaxID=568069 RepID=A0A1J1IDR5_9DIPT|nr:CLUMA_CG010531, isoform A [Clunio marinus]
MFMLEELSLAISVTLKKNLQFSITEHYQSNTIKHFKTNFTCRQNFIDKEKGNFSTHDVLMTLHSFHLIRGNLMPLYKVPEMRSEYFSLLSQI